MTDQPSLWDWRPHARRTDPQTSHDAAASWTEEALNRVEQLIVETIAASMPDGLTVPELSTAIDMRVPVVSPRIRPLCRRNRLEDSGRKRIPPGQTRACIIWAVPSKGN